MAPTMAMAGVEDAAEYRRLTESMSKLAERNAWDGVERNYDAIVELDHDIEARVHRLGAEAARARGDVGAQVTRLQAAETLEQTSEGAAWLAGIVSTYAPVELTARKGERDRLARKPHKPTEPTQSGSLERHR